MKGLKLAGALAAALLVGATASNHPAQAIAASPHSAAPKVATPIVTNGAWPVYHHDDGHTGYDSTQPAATGATTGWASAALDGTIYAEPLVYQGIVYVATLNNSVYAFNQSDGSAIWARNLRAPETTGWSCGNVSPQGIIGTPVIDPAGGRIYVVTLDTTDDLYRVEGLNLVTGVVEVSTVITTMALSGFDWHIEQQRGALALHNGTVYIPFGGRAGDCGNYHGFVFSMNIATGAMGTPYITPGSGAGFWTAGGVVIDDSTGKVFETSGNGVGSGCAANTNGTPTYENDAVVRLSAALAHEDAFIPQDWQANWCANDQDLGSASMVLISPTLAFQAGKWGTGFLVNPQSLGGMDGQLYPTPKPAGYVEANVCRGNHSDANFGSYAYAAPYVYLSCEGNGLVALQVNTSTPSFSNCDATCAGPSWDAGGFSPGPPIVAGGAVWAVDTGGGGLYGFNASTGAQIYHSAGFGVTHFTTPSEAGGQVFVGSGLVVRSFNLINGCSSVTLTAAPSGSAFTGTTVTLSAAASGPVCTSPQYRFWIRPAAGSWSMVQDYSSTSTYSWTSTTTAGGYYLGVHARELGSTAAFESLTSIPYTLTSRACTSVNASAAPASPQAPGTAVTFTGVASTCPSPLYQFWILTPGSSAWTIAQAYSVMATFNWSTTGQTGGLYRFSVWARDSSSTGTSCNSLGCNDAFVPINYSLTSTACTSVTASAAPASPQAPGTAVTFTGVASGCAGTPLYQFWILPPGASTWTVAQAYSTSATFNWTTTGLVGGLYHFGVWVRDGSSSGISCNSLGCNDAFVAINYTLTITTCASVTASAAPPTSSAAGTAVTFTGAASGCPNPLYEFWTLAPGSSTWTVARAYSSTATFNWSTAGPLPAGLYHFGVWVRDAGSSGISCNSLGCNDAFVAINHTLTSTPCTSVSASAAPASPALHGTAVTFTGVAAGCSNPLYQFWILAPGSTTWTVVQAYSTSATFNWSTTGLVAGTYRFSVWVRDSSSAGTTSTSLGTFDAFVGASYTLT